MGPTPQIQGGPRAAVGLPVYNGERYLEASLRAVMAQSLDDIEIIVSDNASTDRSPEIVADLAAKDPRVRLIRQSENLGAAANYNAVVAHATAPFFRWVAADDLMAPTLLERCIELLEAVPGATLAYPRTELIDAEGVHLDFHDDELDLRQSQPWLRAAAFVRHISLCNPVFGVYRTQALKRTGLIRPFRGSDAVLLYEIALLGPICEYSEALFQRRVHADASQESNPSEAALQAWWDPNRQRELTWLTSRQRLLFEYIRVTWSGVLDRPSQRIMATMAVLAVWSYRRARVNAGLLRRRLWRGRYHSRNDDSRFPTAGG